VALHVDAHVGDGALRRDAHHLRQGKRRDRLDDGRPAGRQRQRNQEVDLVLGQDVVNQVLGTGREDESGKPVHQHEHQADGE
jgi:hypothetical protein